MGMTALDNDIIIPNDEQVLDDPLGNLGDIWNTTKNTDSEEEFQPESCTSDEDSSTDDEDYEPQQQPQPRKRISKKPAKYQSTDEEFKTLDQKKLAKMWGERKGNKRMTYNNAARTM